MAKKMGKTVVGSRNDYDDDNHNKEEETKTKKQKMNTTAGGAGHVPLWDDDDDVDYDDDYNDNDDDDNDNNNHNVHHSSNQEVLLINSKFAREFEKKKQRQELQEIQKQNNNEEDEGSSSSTSSSEDEDGDLLITPAMDVQLLKTIQALKRKDAAIYDPNVRFFPSPSESEENEDGDDDDQDDDDDDDDDESANGNQTKRSNKKKKTTTTTTNKKKRFKDVIREQILQDVEKMDQAQKKREHQHDDDDDDDDDDEDETNNKAASGFHSTADRLAYDEEQRQLRKAFLQSHDDDDDKANDSAPIETEKEKNGKKEDWLVVKKKHNASEGDDNNDEQYVRELINLEQVVKSSNSSKSNKMSQGKAKQQPNVSENARPQGLIDPRGEVEDGEQFLLDFLKRKKWKDSIATTSSFHEQEDDDDDDDEEEEQGQSKEDGENDDDNNDDSSLEQLEKSEAFESEYNFRFEQQSENTMSGAALSLQSYARHMGSNSNHNNDNSGTGLLRRPDETRRERRLARLQRKAEERQAKEEQLRRLKNAKRQELQEKLNQIQAILGPTSAARAAKNGGAAAATATAMDEATLMKLLEGDFDPEQFEQIMQQTYGDDFYQQPDEEWKSDADVKKSFLERNGTITTAVDDDEKDIAAAILAVQGDDDNDDEDNDDDDAYDAHMAEDGDEDDNKEEEEERAEYDDDDDEDAFLDTKKNRRTEQTEIEKKLKAKMMEELYKLDYEDIVAGIPTRFKYRQVEPNNYGLSTQEILLARDSLLQQVVSLKQMAPYRETGEFTVNSKKRRRFREMLQQDIAEQQDPSLNDNEQANRNNKAEDETDPNKKKRRRQKKKQKNDIDNKVEHEEADHRKRDKTTNRDSAGAAAATSGPENEEKDNDVETAKSKRRRRKRKSATGNDEKETTQLHSDKALTSTTESNVSKQQREKTSSGVPQPSSSTKSVDTTPKDTVEVPDENKSDKKDHSAHTTKKKIKKKKKLAVKGVSATRFASYGLALAMLVMVVSLDVVPSANAWLSPTSSPSWRTTIGRDWKTHHNRRLAVRLNEQSDPASMKLREIQTELKEKGIAYADCFDRESLVKRLLEARQGLIPEAKTNAPTATDTVNVDSSSSSSTTSSPGTLFDRNAVAQELRSQTVKELREECAQRRIRWANFIEKEDLVQALVDVREMASTFSASGLIVPGQVADLTDDQLTLELESSASSSKLTTPLLLDVYATWCGPCQIMAPQLVLAAQELGATARVAKLDSDRHPMWATRLKVGALPTVIVFDAQGRELERVEGALMKDGLVQLARRHLL